MIVVVILVVTTGCRQGAGRLDIDVSGVAVQEVKIGRYDRDLFAIPPAELAEGLKQLQPRYRFFLGNEVEDPAGIEQIRQYLENPRTIEFQKAVAAKYPSLAPVEKELTDAFRHLRYYNPGAPVPNVYSYISGGDYQHPVELADSVAIIALDTYLGTDYPAYLADGVPRYRLERMQPEYITADVVRLLAARYCPENPEAMTLLDQMVDAGKRSYWTEAMLPSARPGIFFGYSPAQERWIRDNEAHLWAAMIENKMLYSTDGKYARMFFADGPNTAEFGNESPPRMGEWIGWRIVHSFMQANPDVSLEALLRERDGQKILTLSDYKPEK